MGTNAFSVVTRNTPLLTRTEWKYHGIFEDGFGLSQHQFQKQISVLKGEFAAKNVRDADKCTSAIRMTDVVELTAFFFKTLILQKQNERYTDGFKSALCMTKVA